MANLDRITFDSSVMGGRATIRGMRVTVSLIVNLVANGMGTEGIIEAYPYLEPEDIRQSLQCAAWLAEESAHSIDTAMAWSSWPTWASLPGPLRSSGIWDVMQSISMSKAWAVWPTQAYSVKPATGAECS